MYLTIKKYLNIVKRFFKYIQLSKKNKIREIKKNIERVLKIFYF